MRSKFTKRMPAAAAALVAMATYGAFLPSPALAQQSCGQRVHQYCNANWQYYYASREDCLNAELANCLDVAANAADRLAPAIRVE